MTRLIVLLLPIAAAFVASATPASAQALTDYTEFYRLLRLNALEEPVFCYPTTTPEAEPYAVGVLRDTLGRPVRITRFRFGNPDSRSEWTTMRIEYKRFDTIQMLVARRTFHSASGMPIMLDWASAEEVSYKKGQLVMRKLVDRNGKQVNDTVGVSRSFFRLFEPGTILQEWYYSSGKLHYGTGSDRALRPFAAMPPQTYYRKFKFDDNGNLTREEIMDFDRKSLPFPGGEIVRAYDLNECGLPSRVIFLDREGNPMHDREGVATMTFAYDNAGRLIEWRAFSLDGSPHARTSDGIAGIRFTYREFDGVLMSEERFDAKGKKVGSQ